MFRMKYKGVVYLYDNDNTVYSFEDNTMGSRVGYRRLNSKTNKYKIVFD